MNEQSGLQNIDTPIDTLKTLTGVDFRPCANELDFSDTRRFQKLDMDEGQRMQMSAFLHEVPGLMASSAMSKSYVAVFPDGVEHALMPLKQGGVSSVYKDASGNFAGHASLYGMSTQAVVLGAFNVMSIITSQHFLQEINQKLQSISAGLDKVLDFLYGDKKAELLSEVAFVNYANQSYASIMKHDQQRVATIVGLQNSKKVAMKDIEFYLNDLDTAVNTKPKDMPGFIEWCDNIYDRILESFRLALRLYFMSAILEVYFSQDFETPYINFLEEEMGVFADRCNNRLLSDLSILSTNISNFNGSVLTKVDKNTKERYRLRTVEKMESLKAGEKEDIHKELRDALHAPTRRSEYYIMPDGAIYTKAS